MHISGILENLVASLIWIFLGWQVVRLRNKFRIESARRKEVAEKLEMAFAETNSLYESEFKQDIIFAVETIIASSRRLQAEGHFYTLVCLIIFCIAGISSDIYPSDPVRKWIWAIDILPLIFNAYYMVKNSNDIQAYEQAVMLGLQRRFEAKKKIITDKVIQPKTPANVAS
jgi:hypothetical protein